MLRSVGATCGALLTLACAASAAASAAAWTSEAESPETTSLPAVPRLESGTPVENRIEPGDTHVYELAVGGTAHYLRLEADQSEVDVALTLLGPQGDRQAGGDVAGSLFLPEIVSLLTTRAGLYRLEVSPSAAETEGGSYRLTLAELRPEEPGDRARVAAEADLQRGRDLMSAEGADLEKARGALEAALDAARRSGDAVLEGKILHYLAEVDERAGELPTALEGYRRAAAWRRQAGDAAGAHHSLNQVGQKLEQLGRLDEAATAFEEGLEQARQIGDRKLEALSLNNLGVNDFRAGRLAECAEKLGRALEIYRELDEDAGRAKTLGNLGVIYRQLGRLDEAFAAYQEALPLARRMGDIQNEAAILNNLGVLYRVRGEMQRALESYSAGIEAAGQTELALRQRADLHSNLGLLWDRLGYPDRAMASHRTALAINRARDNPSSEAGDLMRIAWLHDSLGEPEKMLPLLDEALELAQASGDLRTRSVVLAATARAWLELGQPDKAIPLGEQSAKLATEASDSSAVALALRHLGRALAESDRPQEARAALERALAIAAGTGDPIAAASTRFALARLGRSEGRLAEARGQMEDALSAIEQLRSELASQQYKASFLAGHQDHYLFLADLLMEMHAAEPESGFDIEAFAVSERSRARSFVELLAEAVADARGGLAPELAERERRLTQRITWTQRELIGLLSGPQSRPQRAAALRQELDGYQEELERLESELRQTHPRYAEVRYPRPAGIEKVQRMLKPDAVLLEYLLGEPRSFLFVVSRDRFSALPLPPASEISPPVRRLRQALSTPGRGGLGAYFSAAAQLFDQLVRPALPLLEQATELTIAPDGELYTLPFEALLTRPATALDREAYLLSRWSVSYVPSASTLSEIRRNSVENRPPKHSHDLLAFGDPALPAATSAPTTRPRPAATRSLDDDRWAWRALPETRREIEAIASLFPADRVEVYVGEAARESRLKQRLAATVPRFLHLASHALVDPRRPADSAILMSPENGGGEDGLLQMHEVFQLELPAELVVLSACETGLGRQVRGEGLIGLSRAFIYAGARSVAVSLWPVADRSTADLMAGFYRRQLMDGERKIEALRQAKLDLAGDPRFAHPYHWAPFVLTGDTD